VSTLLAVDPGIDRCGLAAFVGDRLVWAGHEGMPQKASVDALNRVHATVAHVRAALTSAGFVLETSFDEVAIEWPQVYMPGKSKGDARNLLLLAAIDGALAYATSAKLRAVRPDEWKGQLPDTVVQGRVSARLDLEEAKVLAAAFERVPEGRRHNVTDAVGIGLWTLRRL
jgi:hypothetical protein